MSINDDFDNQTTAFSPFSDLEVNFPHDRPVEALNQVANTFGTTHPFEIHPNDSNNNNGVDAPINIILSGFGTLSKSTLPIAGLETDLNQETITSNIKQSNIIKISRKDSFSLRIEPKKTTSYKLISASDETFSFVIRRESFSISHSKIFKFRRRSTYSLK